MHECRHPHPHSTQQKRDHHKGGVCTRTRACTTNMKVGLERRCFTFDLAEGQFVEGRGGWRTVPGDQWKSWALACRTREKDLHGLWKSAKSWCQGCSRCETPQSPFYFPLSYICEDLNAAKEQESDQPLFSNLAQMEALTCYKFLQTCVIFSCFNHRWLV